MNVGLSSFVPIDIRLFRNAPRDLPFDVYLKVSEGNYAHVFSRTTGIDYRRLATYMAKGLSELHVRREDEPLIHAFVENTLDRVLTDEHASSAARIAALLNKTEQNLAEVFQAVDLPEEVVRASERVVTGYVRMLSQEPQSLALLLKLVSHGDTLYAHAVAVAVFTLVLAKGMARFPERTIESIGLGGFLHDVGFSQVSRAILDKPGELTEDEWRVVEEHPRLGLKILEHTPGIPDEVRYVVYQHHEEPTGMGYPNGLMGSAIFLPARIVAITDAFAAMIARRPYREALSPDEAIRQLLAMPAKFEPELVRLLGRLLFRGRGERAA